MKTRELIELLRTFDPEADVVINPDITEGRYKNSPQNRSKRFSYAPSYDVTDRKVTIAGSTTQVVCIGLAEEVGMVNPLNLV